MYGKYFVLFAILFTEWFLRKINFIDDKMNRSMNKLIVYFAYPCMIVHNIGSLDMSSRILAQFMTAFVISLVCFYIYGAITYGYSKLRRFPAEEANVLEFAMAAPNNGFMGFPVAVLFFGQTGLLMMLAHNAAMNFFIFTYGTRLMRRNFEGRRKATPRAPRTQTPRPSSPPSRPRRPPSPTRSHRVRAPTSRSTRAIRARHPSPRR